MDSSAFVALYRCASVAKDRADLTGGGGGGDDEGNVGEASSFSAVGLRASGRRKPVVVVVVVRSLCLGAALPHFVLRARTYT